MFAFGLIAGIVGGLLGIGGCSIMLPALYFLFNYDLPVAIGTTITAVIITALSGAVAHVRMRNVDYETTAIIAVSGGLGAIAGSLAFEYLVQRADLLNMIIGLAFLYTSARMVYEGIKRQSGTPSTDSLGKIPGPTTHKGVIGLVVGVLTGIVGLGGGYALVPSFIYLLRSPVKIAVGTSLASFIVMSLISAGFKLVGGHVDLVAAILLGAGTAVGAQLGARLVPRTPSWMIKLLFGLIFLYVSLRFILKAFGIVI
ncbi:MAG TPA: sulfite exporter TauE/SafE family protein [Candidatus Korarchaeota archaeon]|nr:sulfite exporter TauE/SafE family protein [Candidatus Korarchaeota archaeon]